MGAVLSYLHSLPPEQVLASFALLVFLTSLGVVPNNNDLTLAAAGAFSVLKSIPPVSFIVVAFCAIALGETGVYFLGRIAGGKILASSFFQKRVSLERLKKIEMQVNTHPAKLLLGIRIVPVLRPYFILAAGSLGLSPRRFFSAHPVILGTYVTLLVTVFHYLGRTLAG